jgi:hypothetical protein
MSCIAMSRTTMNKFELIVATSLIMSAAMASSAWADCQQGSPGCPPLKLDGGGGGTDGGQPLGVYMGQTRENYGLDSSNGSNANSHNGYATAGTGDSARVDYNDLGKPAVVDYNDIGKPARVDYKDLHVTTSDLISSGIISAEDAALGNTALRNWSSNGDPVVSFGTGSTMVTGSNFRLGYGGTIDFTRTIGSDPSTATTVHYDPHNRTTKTTARGGATAPVTPTPGPGSITITKRDGTTTTTTVNPQATAASISAGAAKRAAIKNDPAALAAARAAAQAKASAPSAPHVVSSTSSKPKVAIAPPPVAKPKVPTPTQAVFSSVVARAPASSMR